MMVVVSPQGLSSLPAPVCQSSHLMTGAPPEKQAPPKCKNESGMVVNYDSVKMVVMLHSFPLAPTVCGLDLCVLLDKIDPIQ